MCDLAAKEPLKDVQLEEGLTQRFNLTHVRPSAHRMCFSPAIIHTKKTLVELLIGHEYFHTISEHHTARKRLLFLGKRKDFSELFHCEQVHHPITMDGIYVMSVSINNINKTLSVRRQV